MTSVTVSGRDAAFSSWLSMMRRCFLPVGEVYTYYGGRGITVCERWYDWRNFLQDMGDRPAGTTLDRINVDGDYEPGNCRWADSKTQSRNTRRTSRVELDGVSMVACDAAELLGVSASSVSRRRRSPKVTPDQVRRIKERLASGDTPALIAADVGTTRQQVQGIRDGRVWRIA